MKFLISETKEKKFENPRNPEIGSIEGFVGRKLVALTTFNDRVIRLPSMRTYILTSTSLQHYTRKRGAYFFISHCIARKRGQVQIV